MKNIKKRCGFWAGLVLTVFLAQACQMPSKVTIKGDDIGLDVPVKGEVPFIDMFGNAFGDISMPMPPLSISINSNVGMADVSFSVPASAFGTSQGGPYQIPQEMVTAFNNANSTGPSVPTEFLNALIQEGTFSLTSTTAGVNITGGTLNIKQDPDNTSMTGETFRGLGESGAWPLDNNGSFSLKGSEINGEKPHHE